MGDNESFQALPRRFKVAYIQAEDMLNCLALNASVPEDTLVKVSLGGVPPGTRVVGRQYDAVRCAESLLLYHESWPEVPPYQIPEEIEVTRTHVKVKGTVPRSEMETGHPMNEVTVRLLDGHESTIQDHTTCYTGIIRHKDVISVHTGISEEPTLTRPDETTTDNCLTIGFLDENRDKIKEVSMPFTTQLNGVPAETNQNNAYESYGKVTDTTSFLDKYEETIQKVAIPALTRLNEVTSEPKASWRDLPSLL